jgi:hypothetical protein
MHCRCSVFSETWRRRPGIPGLCSTLSLIQVLIPFWHCRKKIPSFLVHDCVQADVAYMAQALEMRPLLRHDLGSLLARIMTAVRHTWTVSKHHSMHSTYLYLLDDVDKFNSAQGTTGTNRKLTERDTRRGLSGVRTVISESGTYCSTIFQHMRNQ